VKNKLILVDIDQVVCDFVTPFCEWGNQVFGKNVSPEDVDCYDMFRLFGIPPQADGAAVEMFFASIPQIPEVPGAIEVLKMLAEDHEIWYVTARPTMAYGQTEDWLSRRGVLHRIVHCSSADKVRAINSMAKRGMQVVGMIEDNPHTAMEAANHWPVWLLDYPYNQEARHAGIRRVKDWPELVRGILEDKRTAPRLTMTEREYADVRFTEALLAYLGTLTKSPIQVEGKQMVSLPDGQLKLEVYLKAVS